jgi:hypothetical protein
VATRKAVPETAPKKKVKSPVLEASKAAKASMAAESSKTARTQKVARAAKRSNAPKAAKAVRALKSPRGRPAQRKIPVVPLVVAVGDWVLLRGDSDGRPPGLRTEGDGEATEGIVCSIRQIATGKLVAKTKEEPGGYLLEVLHQRTFRSQFSSSRNAGGPGAQALRGPAWSSLRQILQEAAKQRRFYSYASGRLPNEVFGSLLDGWRVVRVRAAAVELRQ